MCLTQTDPVYVCVCVSGPDGRTCPGLMRTGATRSHCSVPLQVHTHTHKASGAEPY